jgi:peptidoglycan/LPS O-acetylase OafA/YrhL
MGSVATVTKPVGAGTDVRYTELDSLRGVAALTVMFYHFRLMWFGYGQGGRWWLTLLSPVTAGHEAVMLFFLLSGFVLSLPYLRGRGQGYPIYLGRRVLRIYGPYFFALMLAIAGAAVWHGYLPFGPWAHLTWSEPVRWKLVLEHGLMIGNYDDAQYNTAFWSLIVEMRVSLVFPMVYLGVRRMGARWALLLALAGTLLTAWGIASWPATKQTLSTLEYGMIFICGIVLAEKIEWANAWFRGLSVRARWGVAVASFGLYTWGFHVASYAPRVKGVDQGLITLGAAGYMLVAMNAEWARRLLGTRLARFLGRVSYSLYLVHGTVLFALAHGLGTRVSVGTQLVLFVGLSLGLSYLFCVGVEEQFLRLSRRVGRKPLPALSF